MLKLKIVSPERIEFDGEVDSVLVPGTMGQFEILNDHAPIISTLQKGFVEYGTNGSYPSSVDTSTSHELPLSP